MSNYIHIGKLVATHGLQGHLILKHQFGKRTALKGLEVVFLEMRKDELLPYFLRSVSVRNESEVQLLLEGIDTKEQAKPLTQKQVWLTQEDMLKFTDESAPLSFLGFEMVNEGESLGEVLEVIEQPHQILLRIDLNGNEALIPIHEETLDKVDRKAKKIFVTLPDGLLDIYR